MNEDGFITYLHYLECLKMAEEIGVDPKIIMEPSVAKKCSEIKQLMESFKDEEVRALSHPFASFIEGWDAPGMEYYDNLSDEEYEEYQELAAKYDKQAKPKQTRRGAY